jgi:hypothetical protein
MTTRRPGRIIHAALALAAMALSPAPARAQCSAFAPPTGYAASCTGTGTAVGDSCAVSCATAAGYWGTPAPSSSTCQAGGTWSATTFTGCVLVTCPAPSAPTGYAITCGGGRTWGSTCAVSCDDTVGYVGSPTLSLVTCGNGGLWSPATGTLSGCALAVCPAPSARIEYAFSCPGTSFGDTCTVGCATGAVGTPVVATITCGLEFGVGVWSTPPDSNSGCALVDCGTPSIDGADATGCAGNTVYGSTCTPPCVAGHSGSPSALCTAAGTWSITGGCSPIPCWPSPGTNGDSCGTGGEACLSGTCAVPAAGQLCPLPATLAHGVARVFSLDAQHDLLAATRCPGDLAAGKDVFVEFGASAGRRYLLEASADGAAGLDAVLLDSCAATACATLDAQATSSTLVATLEPASAGTVVVAVHIRGAPVGASAGVTVSLIPEPPPPPPPTPTPTPTPSGGSSSGCATAPGAAPGLWPVLALALAPWAGRRRRLRR